MIGNMCGISNAGWSRDEYLEIKGDIGKVYMVFVWEAPDASNIILRLLPSKNNQEKNVHWARDYEL